MMSAALESWLTRVLLETRHIHHIRRTTTAAFIAPHWTLKPAILIINMFIKDLFTFLLFGRKWPEI
jgi:hypothetical protein